MAGASLDGFFTTHLAITSLTPSPLLIQKTGQIAELTVLDVELT